VSSGISVLVPTFNRAELLEPCIESLFAQTIAPHEVIVVDDGSTDDTPRRVAHFGTAVKYLRKANGGKSSALNFGMSHVTGDYVWVFDDDDVALPIANEVRLKALATRPDAGFVVTSHLWGRSGADGGIEPLRTHQLPPVDEASFLSVLMSGCLVMHSTALVRTHCYREVGSFREDLTRAQDYDMLLRLALRYPVVLLNEPTYIMRDHGGERGTQSDRFSHLERDHRYVRFDALVGSHLRDITQLGDYLVPRRRATLTPHEECQALLSRMYVMATKGLLDEFLEDATSFVKGSAKLRKHRLTEEERKLAIGAIQLPYLLLRILPAPTDFVTRINRFAETEIGQVLLLGFARGLVGVAWWGEHSLAARFKLLALAARLAVRALRPRHRRTPT